MEDEDYEAQPNLSDDDNAQPEDEEAVVGGAAGEREDPLLLAVDDLEGRIVSALDDVKLHPGVASGSMSIHQELATLLRPVLEVAAHTGPSVARTYFRGSSSLMEGALDQAVEDVYERLVSDLALPVLLEIAQSDQVAAKRGASLEFFRMFWKEAHKAGSWLDGTATTSASSATVGPYGSGGSGMSGHHHHHHHQQALPRAIQNRRRERRLAREGEILRYWIQAAIACLTPGGVFTSQAADEATASRGILAASASLRPALSHIVLRIKAADDRGASRLYTPVMKMLENVLKKLFLSQQPAEAIISACIKFLEIVVLCCSRKLGQETSSRRRGGGASTSSSEDFSLDDLPEGHSVITRGALESLADYAFTTLRGFTLMGGQIKIDVNVLSGMMLTGGSPSEQVVSILKPAALAYLEIESTLPSNADNDEETMDFQLDRSSLEYDFMLAQKSYALTLNAMSALALNRPAFFKEVVLSVARRAVHPPVAAEDGYVGLSVSGVKAITSQIKSSCLTLLRNPLSVSSKSFGILQKALHSFDMDKQSEKALVMARHAHTLKTATRKDRNRANIYYEWDTSGDTDRRVTKRQKETDSDLARLRAVKAARGLGHGIQLPSCMSDAVELVLVNLQHLPTTGRPKSSSSKARKVPVTLDFVVDAIMTNGASLSQEEGRWYKRDGGTAWELDIAGAGDNVRPSAKLVETIEFVHSEGKSGESDEPAAKKRKIFKEQCETAAADALGRIVSSSSYGRSKSLANFGNQIAARLAFELCRTKPSKEQNSAYSMSQESVSGIPNTGDGEHTRVQLTQFIDSFPLAATGLALGATTSAEQKPMTQTDASLALRLLHEAMLQSDKENRDGDATWLYDRSLDLLVASTAQAGRRANEKPNDADRKKTAMQSAVSLLQDIPKVPRLTKSSLLLLCSMCDVEYIAKKAAEASQKTSPEAIATAAAAHAAKEAAEKRATAVLRVLRDVSYQRDEEETRRAAVECAVGIVSGRLPASNDINNKALVLVVDRLYGRNDLLASMVVASATEEIERASRDAVESFESLKKASEEAKEKNETPNKKSPLAPQSDEEKEAMERLRKPVVLYMALCVRRPELIATLFRTSCMDRADVLSKTVQLNMAMLARPAAAKHGAAAIAIDVAGMSSTKETPLLLSFLEHLSSSPDQDLIDACFQIEGSKTDRDGKKDIRYIIPIVSAMKRQNLVERLPEFVKADDKVFLAAAVRMGDRVKRQALLFREEPDEEEPTLHGMTLCEQLVFLHKLDFAAAGIPQKKYLGAINLCLEDDEVYNDRVVMSLLDQISGTFLTGAEKLPLAFMRTCILVLSKHESLQSWISQTLLPRLVDAKIYEDARQWEGWMRCAHMLEKSDDSGVRVKDAIAKLPPTQLMQYNTKWQGR